MAEATEILVRNPQYKVIRASLLKVVNIPGLFTCSSLDANRLMATLLKARILSRSIECSSRF